MMELEVKGLDPVDLSVATTEATVALVLVPGPTGFPGRDGIYWFTGHGNPDQGAIVGSHPGDYYLDLDSGEVYKLGD